MPAGHRKGRSLAYEWLMRCGLDGIKELS